MGKLRRKLHDSIVNQTNFYVNWLKNLYKAINNSPAVQPLAANLRGYQ